MSDHRLVMEYRAKCSCGWFGSLRSGPQAQEDAVLDHAGHKRRCRDYQRHNTDLLHEQLQNRNFKP